MVTVDPNVDRQFEQHRRTWIGFTRFIKISIVFLVILLAGLGYFLT